MCPTIEEYARILGVHYVTHPIVSPPLGTGFKLRTSKVLGIKKRIPGKDNGPDECIRCTLSLLCDLLAGCDVYEKNRMTILISQDEWKYNHSLATDRRFESCDLTKDPRKRRLGLIRF